MRRDREKGLRYIRGRLQRRPSTRIPTSSVLNYATFPPLYVSKTIPLLRLLETMVARGFRRIFVTTTNGVLEGVVTPMEVIGYLLSMVKDSPEMPILNIMSTPVKKVMRRSVVSVNQSESLVESIRMMKNSGVNGLAVVDGNGLLKAVLTVRDVLEKSNYSLTEGTTEVYMSKSPVCISADRTLREGIETMVGSEHRRLPCLRGSKPIGLFSSRSIINFLGGKAFLRQTDKTLSDLMSMSVMEFTVTNLPFLDPSLSISEAWEIVKRSSYGSALVVKTGSLEGFLTEMDFLKAVVV